MMNYCFIILQAQTVVALPPFAHLSLFDPQFSFEPKYLHTKPLPGCPHYFEWHMHKFCVEFIVRHATSHSKLEDLLVSVEQLV